MKITLNSMATVELTPHGLKIYREYLSKMGLPESTAKFDGLNGSTMRTELWNLMSIFGASLHQGGQLPFTSTEIDIQPLE